MAYTEFVRRGIILLVTAACAGADRTPEQTLASLRELVHSEAAHIPNYTCVQTISRRFYSLADKIPQSCADLSSARRKPRLFLANTDRFRLDVRAGPDEEMYSWVGAVPFGDHPLHELIDSGPISTGAFGAALLGLFADAPEFHYTGEKVVKGRRLREFSFHVPELKSHHDFLQFDNSQVAVAYEGTILADPQTGMPVQVTLTAGKLPGATYACGFTATLDYRPVRIGNGDFLLPIEARQRFAMVGGAEVENTVTFSSCREYGAESSIAYAPAAPASNPAAATPAPRPWGNVPEGTSVTVLLTSRIDSALSAAGDPFTGKLANSLLDDAGNTIVPKGALVRGRITRLGQRFLIPTQGGPIPGAQPRPSTGIELQAESISVDGHEMPAHLVGKRDLVAYRALSSRLASYGAPIAEFPERLRVGYATLQCVGTCAFPAGSKTEWVTVGR